MLTILFLFNSCVCNGKVHFAELNKVLALVRRTPWLVFAHSIGYGEEFVHIMYSQVQCFI